MTDTDAPEDRSEPVLVRPYVTTEPAAATAAETWPEDSDLPDEAEPGDAEPGDADTLVQPAVPADEPLPSPRPGGLPLWGRLLVLVGGIALAGGLTAWLILGTGGPGGSQPTTALPKPEAVLPNGAVPSAAPHASASVSPSTSVSPSPSATVSAPVTQAFSAVPPASVPASAPPSEPTLGPPPAGDRSGKITAASGRCLTMGGLIGIDGTPVSVSSCGVAQQFTLASDGTLRVSGKCAQVTGDSTVHVVRCDDRDSAQWRSGRSGSLVNPASGQCLTDPGSLGATTKVSSCGGGDDQSWSMG